MERDVFYNSGEFYRDVNKQTYQPGEIISRLKEDIQRSGFTEAVIEGMPFRAYPDWDSSDLAWNGEGFQGGYLFADRLYQELSTVVSVKHMLLIDDYMHDGNILRPRLNKANQSDEEFIEEIIESVQDEFQEKFKKPLLLFSNIEKVFLESKIEEEYSAHNCSERDLHFQRNKNILDPKSLQIIIHPKKVYQEQQLQMLGALYGYFRSQDDNVLRKDKKSIISRYRHVWIGQNGDIMDVTQPYFSKDGGHINFRSLVGK